MKHILITLALLLPTLHASADDFDFVEYTSNGWSLLTCGPETVLWATCLSPNGRYVSCWRDTGVGTTLLDMWTGASYDHGGGGEGSAISNDGLVVGTNGTFNPVTGNAPQGAGINGYGISSDGSIIVGISGGGAAVYKDGKTTTLPRPTSRQVGGEFQSIRAIDVADDGSVICGYVETWLAAQGMILWRLNADGDYELDPVCGDYLEFEFTGDKPYLEFAPTGMSHDGKWVGLTVSENDGAWGGTTHAVWYSVETGEIIEPEELFTCASTRLSSNGEMLVHTGDIDSQNRKAMLWILGEPSPQYLSDLYPNVPEFASYDDDTWNYGVGISADGRYIAGMGWHYIEGYDEYYARRVSWYFDREAYNAVPEGVEDSSHGITIVSEEYYTLDGKRVDAPQKGVTIVKSGDKARKVMTR